MLVSLVRPVPVIRNCFEPVRSMLKFENVITPLLSERMVVVPPSVPDPINEAVEEIPGSATLLWLASFNCKEMAGVMTAPETVFVGC